ncbi:TPA: hypothetical protein ACG1TJ_004464 [Salmonella enterica]
MTSSQGLGRRTGAAPVPVAPQARFYGARAGGWRYRWRGMTTPFPPQHQQHQTAGGSAPG